MLPEPLKKAIEQRLALHIERAVPVGGGCIARGTRLDTDRGPFFLKWGPEEVARTFPAEAHGLQALREAGSPLVIPTPLAWEVSPEGGWLVMEWLEPGTPGPDFWERFGRGLAALHRHTGPAYGFHEDNFIGRTPQPNRWHPTWPEFFREERLAYQMNLARRQGYWSRSWDRPAERVLERLPSWLPERPEPSMVHGDLWAGNYMVTTGGKPALIDPAVYFGHREVDLAMSELFGGFDPRFYAAYQEAWPLEPGYAERRDLYNLYHLLNHLNLFGSGYASSVERILKRYGR